MKRDKTANPTYIENPPAGPMFTRRLLLGYSGVAILLVGVSGSLGGISSAATPLGLDVFIDSLVFSVFAGCLFAGILGFSLRGGRRPIILIPIGYTLLAGYGAAILWYVVLRIFPSLIVDPGMTIMANLAAILLVLLVPPVIFVWRMVRDPALRRES